jgi:hypothetical protein
VVAANTGARIRRGKTAERAKTMTEQAIRNIERKLNDLAKSHETYTGSVFADTGKAYAQGIAFALAEIGYSVEWENGTAHVVETK